MSEKEDTDFIIKNYVDSRTFFTGDGISLPISAKKIYAEFLGYKEESDAEFMEHLRKNERLQKDKREENDRANEKCVIAWKGY